MIAENMRHLDALKPWYVFRSAITGQYVTRLYAFLHPAITVKERRWKK